MNYLLNQIGITALSVLLATATCNNGTKTETEETSSTPETEMLSNADPVTEPAPVPTDSSANKVRDTVEIKTSMGDITVVLYNETPLHHDNFLKLVTSNYYDGILFHRVIANFMIQTGDPNSRDSDPSNDGAGGPNYTIPAEFNPMFKHKRGALAAARTGDQINPQKASSGSQFYICHVATPFLDGQYTVFGETIKGLDVVDKIATTKTHPGDRPVNDIKIISTKHVNAPKTAAKKDDTKKKKGSK